MDVCVVIGGGEWMCSQEGVAVCGCERLGEWKHIEGEVCVGV